MADFWRLRNSIVHDQRGLQEEDILKIKEGIRFIINITDNHEAE
ncbi:MAG: hypothetical protein BAJATHORv1_30332 [Candidatus Thorarchaeota archaeon]|nr:MAG: hypothetical protein BAJATHORv1_30332 [Candidatus Thorarchaeota archaeon]